MAQRGFVGYGWLVDPTVGAGGKRGDDGFWWPISRIRRENICTPFVFTRDVIWKTPSQPSIHVFFLLFLRIYIRKNPLGKSLPCPWREHICPSSKTFPSYCFLQTVRAISFLSWNTSSHSEEKNISMLHLNFFPSIFAPADGKKFDMGVWINGIVGIHQRLLNLLAMSLAAERLLTKQNL